MSTGSGPLGRDRIDRDATSATGLLPKGGIQPLSFRECKGLTCRVRDRPRTTSNVDPEDHVWVFDRCEDKGCAGSSLAPNLGNSPPAAFGRRHVRCPHQVVPGRR
jgi:hypothetical protein